MPGGGQGPISVNRNVTVSAALGNESILDFKFKRSAVELCNTCAVRFENITVSNERRGPGPGVDLFLGRPGSRVDYDNANRFRAACPASNESGAVQTATPRSAFFPDPTGTSLWSIVNVTFRSSVYTNQLHLIDQSNDDPHKVQEGRGPVGGIAIRNRNTTRICRSTVDEQCLLERSSDACVNMLMDKMLAQDAAAAAGTAPRSNTAAIAAAAAVAGVVLLAALVATLLLVRRHRRSAAQQQLLPVAADGCKPLGPGSRGAQECESDTATDRLEHMARKQSRRNKALEAPEGKDEGWDLSWTLTTPLVPKDERDAPIELGELLGAGSFGRVFKGRWAGRDVAVKIISHDTASSDAVENEIALMVGFNHPNIVRAFHSVTYIKSRQHNNQQHSISPGLPATAADLDSFSTSGSSSHIRQGSSSSQQAQATPSGAPPALPAVSASPFAAAQEVLPAWPAANSAAAAAAADASCSDQQQHTAAAVAAVEARQSAWGEGVLSTQESSADAYGATCSSSAEAALQDGELQAAGRSASARACRVETWILQEYCDKGTLDSVVTSWEGKEEGDARMLQRLLLLKDVASGLQALHANNVVHGDLNARNVLVSSSSMAECGMVAKLADLGLSRAIKQHKTHRTTNTIGTMSHMPPEMLRYGRMSPAGDIYAFGISMWEMYTGTAAFKKLHYGQFFEYICLRNLRPLMPADAPKDYAILMESCWAADPANRPKAERVVECLRYMIVERQRNLAAAAAAAAEDTSAASAAMAPDTPATGGGMQPMFLKLPSLLRRAAADQASPKKTAAAAASSPAAPSTSSDAVNSTDDAARQLLQSETGSKPGASSPRASASQRLSIGSISSSRALPIPLSVDIYGAYSAQSKPTGLLRAFSAADKGSGREQGPGAAGATDKEVAGEVSGECVQQLKLLLPQNSVVDGVHWFV
uniref:Protein kinase domain-containing protein n=1 Tax=Tetradesmus obliquus TaxID=3088 RepID=A0A383W352_TETOB|eukprot:jgi/Sobl393_1/10010/SZX71569.1